LVLTASGPLSPQAEVRNARLSANTLPFPWQDISPLPLFPAKAGTQAFSFVAFFVYLLASRRNGTLYLGYTDDIFRRVAEHRAHSLGGFSAKYKVEYLVWYETHETRESAWLRERRMKKWRRAWKLEPIERFNPTWRDLFEDFG
jgi:putative endonuclease